MYCVRPILVLFGLIALTVPLAASPPIANASVWVSAQGPLEVCGSGFKPNERVTLIVMVSTGNRFDQAITATDTGSFVARWTGFTTGNRPCVGIFVKASGDHGSSANWRSSVAEDCTDGPTP
jgi:hypothetical protein